MYPTKDRSSSKILAVGALIACAFALFGCQSSPTIVNPPTAGSDYPEITIGNLLFGPGSLDLPNLDTNTLPHPGSPGNFASGVKVTRYAQITLDGAATDLKAGIKSMSLKVYRTANTPPGPTIYNVQQDFPLSGSGYAQTVRPIEGEHLESLRAGGAVPFGTHLIQFTINEVIPEVVVTATNFEGNTTTLTINYAPVDPLHLTLTASPATIDRGGTSTLNMGLNATTPTAVTISPVVPIGVEGTPVMPLVTTTYTVTADQNMPNPSSFPNPPPATGATSFPTIVSAHATVTVKQPVNPPPAAPLVVPIYPAKASDGSLIYYQLMTPYGLSSPGTITKLVNANYFPISIVKAGFDPTTASTNPGDYVTLANLGNSVSAGTILGSNVHFPLNNLYVLLAPGNTPPNITVDLDYTDP
jgi:hypothetical protein